MKWEYKVIFSSHLQSECESMLNTLGLDGWELVTIAYTNIGCNLFMKRPMNTAFENRNVSAKLAAHEEPTATTDDDSYQMPQVSPRESTVQEIDSEKIESNLFNEGISEAGNY